MRDKGTAFTWACRSAIQQAVRRSDPVLLSKVFDDVWETDRAYLMKRLPIIAAETVWPLVGIVSLVVQLASDELKHDQKKARGLALRALRLMCMTKKATGASGLARLAVYGPYNIQGITDSELDVPYQDMLTLLARLGNFVPKSTEDASVWDYLESRAESEFCSDIVQASRMGYTRSFPSDKHKFLATAVLALHWQDVRPERMNDMAFAGGSGSVTLPLWCFDRHTLIGRIAFGRAAKNLNMSYAKVASAWAVLVTEHCNPVMVGDAPYWSILVDIVRASLSPAKWADIIAEVTKQIKSRARYEGVKVELGGVPWYSVGIPKDRLLVAMPIKQRNFPVAVNRRKLARGK